MKPNPDINKLETEMGKTWRDRPSPEIPYGWREKVMDSVRQVSGSQASGSQTNNHQNPIHKIVFKCAVLAASAALLFLILIPKDVLSTDQSLFQLIMQDPAGFLSNLPIGF